MGNKFTSAKGLHANQKSQGRRCLDLVPVICDAADGSGHTKALYAQCSTEHYGSVSSARTFNVTSEEEDVFGVTRWEIVGLNK